MANRHFGKIGDIWKHLPLAEILYNVEPKHYWETNSGAALYELSHSIERDYGIFYFYEQANNSLRKSCYYKLLEDIKDGNSLTIFPGSPLIALKILGDKSKYLFCDIDNFSLENIKNSVCSLNIDLKVADCINNDGVRTFIKRNELTSEQDKMETFIHVDPGGGYVDNVYYFDNPFIKDSEDRPSPIECFISLTKQGYKGMFWYGFDTLRDGEIIHNIIRGILKNQGLNASDINLWCGEIWLKEINNLELNINPGVKGCGVICCNINNNILDKCSVLGQSMVEIYKPYCFENGISGALEFEIAKI